MVKILLGLAVIFAVSFVAITYSRSFLSDTENSTTNNFSAGTFDISDNANTLVPFDFSSLHPGDHVSKTVSLKNIGSVDIASLSVTAANKTGDIGLLDQLSVSPLLNDTNILVATTIHPNDVYTITFDFTVPSDLGPEWQGKTMQFDLNFNAKQ